MGHDVELRVTLVAREPMENSTRSFCLFENWDVKLGGEEKGREGSLKNSLVDYRFINRNVSKLSDLICLEVGQDALMGRK